MCRVICLCDKREYLAPIEPTRHASSRWDDVPFQFGGTSEGTRIPPELAGSLNKAFKSKSRWSCLDRTGMFLSTNGRKLPAPISNRENDKYVHDKCQQQQWGEFMCMESMSHHLTWNAGVVNRSIPEQKGTCGEPVGMACMVNMAGCRELQLTRRQRDVLFTQNSGPCSLKRKQTKIQVALESMPNDGLWAGTINKAR